MEAVGGDMVAAASHHNKLKVRMARQIERMNKGLLKSIAGVRNP